jgi:hypothetical protein
MIGDELLTRRQLLSASPRFSRQALTQISASPIVSSTLGPGPACFGRGIAAEFCALVTALSRVIGYDKTSRIAHYAMDNDLTLKAVALKLGFVSEEQCTA